MAKFKPNPGENLIGESWMALRTKSGLGHHQENTKVHVTDQRVFCDHMIGTVYMDVPLAQIQGFRMGKVMLLVPSVTIFTKDDVEYVFADLRANKLAGWLREAGIAELS